MSSCNFNVNIQKMKLPPSATHPVSSTTAQRWLGGAPAQGRGEEAGMARGRPAGQGAPRRQRPRAAARQRHAPHGALTLKIWLFGHCHLFIIEICSYILWVSYSIDRALVIRSSKVSFPIHKRMNNVNDPST